MSINISDTFVKSFLSEKEIEALKTLADDALSTVQNKSGEGADFLGWTGE